MRGAGFIRFFDEELPKLFRQKTSPTPTKKSWVFITTPAEDFNWQPAGIYLERITQTLRQSIQTKQRSERQKSRLGYIVAIMIALPFAYYFFFQIIGIPWGFESTNFPRVSESEQRIQQEKIERKYLFLVSDGDQWFENGNYYNAIFQYKKAIEVVPTNDAKYRLAMAYSESCLQQSESCEEAKSLINLLVKQFPLDSEIQLLHSEIMSY